MTNSEKYIAHETKMQKLRLATPVGLFANLFTSIGGMALVIYFANRMIGGFDSTIEKLNERVSQTDSVLFNRINEMTATERTDVLTLTAKVYGCCGAKGG